MGCFRPLSWGLSFNEYWNQQICWNQQFSSPFLGTFFQYFTRAREKTVSRCFRPLSWGLSFNNDRVLQKQERKQSFSSPFLRTFFQFHSRSLVWVRQSWSFRPLSWGLSFNGEYATHNPWGAARFRPLSWGLSFNGKRISVQRGQTQVFVPFLDFLSIKSSWTL